MRLLNFHKTTHNVLWQISSHTHSYTHTYTLTHTHKLTHTHSHTHFGLLHNIILMLMRMKVLSALCEQLNSRYNSSTFTSRMFSLNLSRHMNVQIIYSFISKDIRISPFPSKLSPMCLHSNYRNQSGNRIVFLTRSCPGILIQSVIFQGFITQIN